MTEQLNLFDFQIEEVKAEPKSNLTPRQWALYRLIKENTEQGRKTTQREICDKIPEYTWNEKGSGAHDHCPSIWTDIYGDDGINFNPHIHKIIDGTNFEYFVCNEEEAQAFADKLWKALEPRLTRYWATVAKIESDGQCQLFDADGKLITEGSGARGYIESFLQHPPLD